MDRSSEEKKREKSRVINMSAEVINVSCERFVVSNSLKNCDPTFSMSSVIIDGDFGGKEV